jgi:drug/metabolite transporter (DMT)-like permease
MKPVFLILMIGMNLLWAGSYSIFKVLGSYLSSGSIATVRFGLAAVLVLGIWPWLPGRGPRGRDLVRAIFLGVFVFCLAPRLQIEGVHRGQAGDTSLLLALDPLITSLAAALFLREQIIPRRWWGCTLGMVGVVLVSQVWRDDVHTLNGLLANLLFIASFFGEATYSVLGKPALERVGTLKLLGSGLITGTVANVTLDWSTGAATFTVLPALPIKAWLLLIYLAVVCTVIGYGLWYVVIRETEVNLTGMTVFVQPVAGLLISVIWLGERLHWGQLWGSLAIIAGLIIAFRPGRRIVRKTNDVQLEFSPVGVADCQEND